MAKAALYKGCRAADLPDNLRNIKLHIGVQVFVGRYVHSLKKKYE